MTDAQADVDAAARVEARARRELIVSHLPLIRPVVLNMAAGWPPHVDREDLVATGALGLIDAAHRYDPGTGVPFASYATWRIRGSVLDAVRVADWAPRNLRGFERRQHVAGAPRPAGVAARHGRRLRHARGHGRRALPRLVFAS